MNGEKLYPACTTKFTKKGIKKASRCYLEAFFMPGTRIELARRLTAEGF